MTKKDFKFFPREKDRKTEEIVENKDEKTIDENDEKFISKQKKKGKSQKE